VLASPNWGIPSKNQDWKFKFKEVTNASSPMGVEEK
jgi:hypothetical protein